MSQKIADSKVPDASGRVDRRAKKPPFLKGYLKKQGAKRLSAYKKRYFLQNEDKLNYFVSHKDLVRGQKGFIDLTTVLNVAIVDSSKGLFELYSPERIYRLQVYDESDMSIEQWIKGVQLWLDHIAYRRERKYRHMTEVLQPITVSSSEAGSARTTIISPGAVPVSAPMARSVDDYTPEEIAKLIQTHQLMTREMQNLDEVMRTLDQQVGEYERELNDFERTKERVIEEHRAANIQALDGKEREIEKAKQKLAALEKELQEVEINCDNANAEVYRLYEEKKTTEYIEDALLKQAEEWERELDLREKAVEMMREKVFQLPQAKGPPANTEAANKQREIQRMLEEQLRMQLTSERLERQARQEQAETDAILKAKAEILASLQKEYDITLDALRQLEDHVVESEGIDRSMLKEIEELKEHYFASVAVGIKLQGQVTEAWKTRDVSIPELYQATLISHPDWKTWADLLKNYLIIPTRPDPFAARRAAKLRHDEEMRHQSMRYESGSGPGQSSSGRSRSQSDPRDRPSSLPMAAPNGSGAQSSQPMNVAQSMPVNINSGSAGYRRPSTSGSDDEYMPSSLPNQSPASIMNSSQSYSSAVPITGQQHHRRQNTIMEDSGADIDLPIPESLPTTWRPMETRSIGFERPPSGNSF